MPGRLKRGLCEKHYQRQRRHGTTLNPLIDNWSRYEVDDRGCWIWTGSTYANGYGKLSRRIHGTCIAHRAFYIHFVDDPPAGADLDHLCRVRRCVNPWHLEPVSRMENLARGSGFQIQMGQTCRSGAHVILTTDDLHIDGYGRRTCKRCWQIRYRAAGRRYRQRLKAR